MVKQEGRQTLHCMTHIQAPMSTSSHSAEVSLSKELDPPALLFCSSSLSPPAAREKMKGTLSPTQVKLLSPKEISFKFYWLELCYKKIWILTFESYSRYKPGTLPRRLKRLLRKLYRLQKVILTAAPHAGITSADTKSSNCKLLPQHEARQTTVFSERLKHVVFFHFPPALFGLKTNFTWSSEWSRSENVATKAVVQFSVWKVQEQLIKSALKS